MAKGVKKGEEVRTILVQACDRRELLILATPYLRFESGFLAIEGDELHIRATMTREDAAYGLRGPSLTIRFPDKEGFFEGEVAFRGLGLYDGRRTVRLSLPRLLQENDHRTEDRAEPAGRVTVTYNIFNSRDLAQASLVDLSVSGARILTQRDLDPLDVRPGTRLTISIPVSDGLRIEARAEIRHAEARTVGMAFTPALPADLGQELARWVFRRQEEEQERVALRADQAGRAASLARSPGAPPASGILLVSADEALEAALRTALAALDGLARVAPAAQPLKNALAGAPPLVIFHLAGASLDARRQVKALVELAQGKAPALLVGTDVDGATLFELSSEWKAASALLWNPSRGPFLQRLAQGIIRRHTHGGTAPMAPAESQGRS